MKKTLAALTLIATLAMGLSLPAAAIPGKGDLAPDFTLTSLDGEESFTLSALRGQVVYIDFWASWCGPCRKSFPEVQALHNEYGERGFQVVGVSLDRKAADGLKFAKQSKATFPLVFDEGGSVASNYGVRSIPSMLIVGPDGKVAYSTVGFDPRTLPTIKATIEGLLPAASDAAPAKPSLVKGDGAE